MANLLLPFKLCMSQSAMQLQIPQQVFAPKPTTVLLSYQQKTLQLALDSRDM